jgi:uncharacterized protein DUF4395
MSVDPRGLRFTAWLSALVLALTLLTGSPWLAGAQALVFAAGAILGLRYAPYGALFRAVIRPRLGPPRELEPAAPPRFAQAVGLFFAVLGTVGYATGLTPLGVTAIGLALAAAFLNAAFGLCLGCELYLLIRRMTTAHPEGVTA